MLNSSYLDEYKVRWRKKATFLKFHGVEKEKSLEISGCGFGRSCVLASNIELTTVKILARYLDPKVDFDLNTSQAGGGSN